MYIIDCVQGSQEWLDVRMGKMTASHAQAIATQGKGLETYCRHIAAEIFTGERLENYTNENMRRGNDEEPIARMAYSIETGHEVREVGFVQHNNFVGCSPDGLVGRDGGVEIKRKTFDKHNDLLLGAAGFESQYVWQCHMNMLIRGAQWWDLISFNPLFKDRCLFIERIYRDQEKDRQLLSGFEKGEKLILKHLEHLKI